MTTDDDKPGTVIESEPMPEAEANATVASAPSRTHPYRDRYFYPFIFPIMIVVALVFYVLNISRIFLATKGTTAVVIAASLTVIILLGAAVLSSATKMRSSSIGLIVVGALVVVTMGGFVTLGHSEQKKEVTITLGPPVGVVNVTAEQSLKFTPAGTINVPFDPAGQGGYTVIKINYHDAPPGGTHTFDFDDPTVVWTPFEVSNANEIKTQDAGFPKAGQYVFYCAISGHRAAGMQGTINVTAALKPQKVASTPAAGATTTTKG
jgi:plastocyanin